MVRGRLARDGLIAFVLVRSLERGRDGKIGGDASQAFGNERTGRRASLRAQTLAGAHPLSRRRASGDRQSYRRARDPRYCQGKTELAFRWIKGRAASALLPSIPSLKPASSTTSSLLLILPTSCTKSLQADPTAASMNLCHGHGILLLKRWPRKQLAPSDHYVASARPALHRRAVVEAVAGQLQQCGFGSDRPRIALFPAATILRASSGNGLCSVIASDAGALSQVSTSSGGPKHATPLALQRSPMRSR